MDIDLGKINITKEQFENAHTVKPAEHIRGYGAHYDKSGNIEKFIVVSERELSQEERAELIADLEALPKINLAKEERSVEKKRVLEKLKLDDGDIAGLENLLKDGHSN